MPSDGLKSINQRWRIVIGAEKSRQALGVEIFYLHRGKYCTGK